MKILVLDAEQRSSLAVARSLTRIPGAQVYQGSSQPNSALISRLTRNPLISYESIDKGVFAFTESILKTIREMGLQLVIPTTDASMVACVQNREAFPEPTQRILPNSESFETLTNKASLTRLATNLGLPIPASQYFDSGISSIAELGEISYPCVLKPSKSVFIDNGRIQRSKVYTIRSEKHLEEVITQSSFNPKQAFMIQEFIPGHGAGVFLHYDLGSQKAVFAHNRLREKPPSGGTSVLCESTFPNPAALACATQLLDSVRWHGPAMVEFRIAEDGIPYLMEVNTRFWGSLQLAVDSNVDFPKLTYLQANALPLPKIKSYRVGRKLRWFLGDLDNLYLQIRSNELTATQKLAAALRFLTPSPLRTRHDVFRWKDPKPFFCELRNYVSSLRKAKSPDSGD